jgi:hypothetical protein
MVKSAALIDQSPDALPCVEHREITQRHCRVHEVITCGLGAIPFDIIGEALLFRAKISTNIQNP